MLSYSRREIIGLLSLAVLAGCEFRPIYAEGTAARALIGKIALGQVSDRIGFEMHEQLELRLGKAVDPIYLLDVQIRIESEGLAITPDAAITRFNLSAAATYKLVPIGGGDAVLIDRASSFTAYSATASAFATRVAERDARRRLAVAIANQIATRIAATAADLPA